jgi:hypothetical protein
VSWPQLIKTYTATGGVSYSEDIDISAWAANQPTVQIGYRFISTADVNLTDYFYFDSFWIGNEVPVITEYFNNYVAGYYTLPTGWTTQVTNPTGKWWMYQSGTTVYPKVNESGSNQQAQDEWIISKTIDCSALTNVSLQFTKYFYRSTTGPDSTAQVLGSIDGGATWTQYIVNYTATSSTAETRYITSWAAGQANVKIAFRFISTADTSLGDYFYFDDFFVGSMWGPYGNNPPTCWTILDYGTQSPPVWDNNDWHRYSTSTYPAQGQFARVYYSPVETQQNEWLVSPSIDCSALTTVTLEFWHYFNWFSTKSKGYVNGSIDGGVTFPYVIASYTTVDDGPAIRTFDISSWAAGQSNVKILFQYMDNNGMYWYVDDFKIKSDTTTIYSQNFEGVGYFENFASNYIPANWGPLGWYTIPTGDTHWSASSTTYAGGASPELKFYYSPTVTADLSLCTAPMDTSAYTALTLSFKHYVDWYANPFTLKVETSTDGTTWGTVWSISPTADIPASTVVVPLNSTQGIGSPTFRMRFTFSGYTNNINYWYIDNVKLGTMVTIYTTTFNENWIPPSWGPGGFTDVIQQGTHGWLRNDLYNNRPNYAGGQGYCADADSDAVGSGGPWPMECALISPSIDLTGLTSTMLSYTAAYNDISTGVGTDYADVDISIDGGTSWATLSHWDVDHSAYGPGEAVQLDISPYCGNANVQIRFHYFAPGWDYYFEVDNVKIATVSTVYNTTFNENWIPTSWGPAGWQQVVVSGTDPDNEWDVVTTSSYPSGVVPHGDLYMAQYDSWYISTGNSCRLYMPNPIDFSSIGSPAIQAKMWMYHDPGYATPPYDRVEVQVSLDGTTWNTVGSVDRYAPVAHWEEHTFDFSAYATETTVYIGFLGISQYGNSIYMDDLSLEYYGLLPDGNPSDNEMVNWITLTYTHDTGVTEITQPTGPEGNWPPGTYSVAGVIENFGSFTEYDVLVNTKIWKIVEEKADILFYEENVTVPALAIDGTAAVTFPDVTFENADEGNFRLEMRTMLAGDDHPNNDKMTKTFVIQAPDTTPPVTTAELTGTIGQDNWYVTNVTITLTATDPAGKIFKGEGDGKWPLGVNHTYYKIDSGNWTEYIEPVVVTGDGQHKVCFYSDDKAIPPNVEEEKNVSFKMDKTAPEWINYTITPLNLLKTKWLCAANVTDATSGIVLVEFYVDDALVGNATTIPYEFTYEGSGNNSQAVAYDAAGNSAMSPIVSSTEFIVIQQQYTQSQQTMQSLKLKLA